MRRERGLTHRSPLTEAEIADEENTQPELTDMMQCAGCGYQEVLVKLRSTVEAEYIRCPECDDHRWLFQDEVVNESRGKPAWAR